MFNRPMTKPMLTPYLSEDEQKIVVGGFQQNLARELETDTPALFLDFLECLDGNHCVAEISSRFGLSEEEVTEVLTSLQEAGVIQENDSSVDFTEEMAQYYSRNINFFAWIDKAGSYYNYYDVQKKLSAARVLVLGAGGTGGHTATNLARLGIGNLVLVDFDTVDISNLNRQMFFYSDIGRPKVEALCKQLQKVNPFISIQSVNKRIASVDDIVDIGTDFDLVVCCIDKPKNVLEILEAYTALTQIPRVLGSYASTVINYSLFDAKTYSQVEYIQKEQQINHDAKKIHTNTHWKWDNAVVAPVASLSGSLSALLVLYHLTGLSEVKPGLMHHVDLYNLHNEHFTYHLPKEHY